MAYFPQVAGKTCLQLAGKLVEVSFIVLYFMFPIKYLRHTRYSRNTEYIQVITENHIQNGNLFFHITSPEVGIWGLVSSLTQQCYDYFHLSSSSLQGAKMTLLFQADVDAETASLEEERNIPSNTHHLGRNLP